MKVVFLEEVEGSGRVGEVKEVRNGYARNYLLPRGLAAPATKAVMERAVKLAKVAVVRQEQLDGAAQRLAERIDGATLTVSAKVGEQGRLFGSVTAADIAERLSEIAGETVEHRQVLLGQAIKELGSQALRVRLTRNVSASVTVTVEAEGVEATPAEASEAGESEADEPEAGELKADTESEAEHPAPAADEPHNDDE